MRAMTCTVLLGALLSGFLSGCTVTHVRKVPINVAFPAPRPADERLSGVMLALDEGAEGTLLGEAREGTVFGLLTVRDQFVADTKRSHLVENALHKHAAEAGIALGVRPARGKPWDTAGVVDGQFILATNVTSFVMKNVTSGPPFYSIPKSVEAAVEVETTMYAPGNSTPVWRHAWAGSGASTDATTAVFDALDALRIVFTDPGFASAADALQAKAQTTLEKKIGELSGSGDVAGSLLALGTAYRGCPEGARSDALFARIVEATKALGQRPPLSENGRRFAVQAEAAAVAKNYDEAIRLFGEATAVCPWWAQGHYNRALLLAERGQTAAAIKAMKRFIALAPDSPDARTGQDRIYEWETRPR